MIEKLDGFSRETLEERIQVDEVVIDRLEKDVKELRAEIKVLDDTIDVLLRKLGGL